MQLGVGGQLGCRDGEDLHVVVESLTAEGASLVGPQERRGGELAVADQVRAAVTLPHQLAGALLDQPLLRDRRRCGYAGTCSKLLNLGQRRVGLSEVHAGLGIDQVDLAQTDHREVDVAVGLRSGRLEV